MNTTSENPTQKDVYGYWLFIVGYIIGAAGVATFVVGYAGEGTLTRSSASPGDGGDGARAFCLLGIVLMLPVRRRGFRSVSLDY